MSDKADSTGPQSTGPSAGAPAGGGKEPQAESPELERMGDSEMVRVLEARVSELEAQQEDLTDRLLRAHAEMDNLRKRTEREKSETAKYAISKFANDIVGISDNFQRAVAAVPPDAAQHDATLKSLVEGVEMTERAFLQVLERHGVKRIDAEGAPFNPNVHQAVMERENTEVAAGTVIQVFQPGYMIDDRVLRPAMVVVSRGGAKAAKAQASEGGATPPATPANDDGPDKAGGTSGG